MKRITRLDQINMMDIICPCLAMNKAGHEFTAEELTAAYVRVSCRGTRWDNKTGRLLDIEGELSRYSIQSEFVPHETEADVIEWEFVCTVRGDAARYRNCIAAGVKY